MFKNVLQFEVAYQMKQRAFPLFALLFLGLGVFVGRQGFAPKGINFNSVYQVYFHVSLFTLGSVFIIMFFAISAMLRDKLSQMEELIYSSSIKKTDFFWSRFLGTVIFSVLAFSPFILGYIFGNFYSDLEPERLGDFQLLTYLQPWLYIVVPNIFICATIIFSVATLTKNSTATYVSAVFVYMLYFVSSIYLNSPLIAQAVPASPESMAIAAVADPFGIAAFFEQTQYWTPYQKNTQLISFSGLFLLNRLVWMVVSIGLLLATYTIFSFRKMTQKVKKSKKVKTQKKPIFIYRPLKVIHNSKAQFAAYISLLKLELKGVVMSLPFIAVMIMWLFIVFSELFATVIRGGEYGVSRYPFSNQLIELIVDPLTIFSVILIVFYSAEIVWKERNLNFNLIVDATPVKNHVFFLSKFTALLMLPIILITVGITMCIVFQVALGYSNFEFHLYASLYYYYGLQLMVFSMIALFICSLAKSKYLGMGIFGLVVILFLRSDLLGLEYPLTSPGFMPRVSYSNMNGFYDGQELFDHLALYWLTFGLILAMFTFKIWHRGLVTGYSHKLKQLTAYWTRGQKFSTLALIVLFLGAGSLVYYNVNILTEYSTVNDQLDYSENYERNYKKYDSIERLYPTSKKTKVDFYPNDRQYSVSADYILKNKSDAPLSELFITERLPLTSISIENARLIAHDTAYGTYLFEYDKPLQPNDSIRFSFELTKKINGYDDDKSIVSNGTYINQFNNFEPILGYTTGLEISNTVEREKRNLPKQVEEDNSDAHIVFEDSQYEKIRFETIISTAGDQTALSSGRLINKWSENGRNFYHYKCREKILPEVGYFSARYTSTKIDYKGVSVEQYFDENHSFNVEEIENSVKQTLDYCQNNFGEYNFDHVRIAEVPSHWFFGGFAHPGMISMTEHKLYLNDVSDEETFNLVAKRTIHEVAHQWWGHTLSAKPVAGGSLFIEGFAKYTEAVVLEKMYGKRALYPLVEDARSRYFSGRSMASELEPPVYKVLGQSYISYGKALTVMLALRDLIGEENINLVLRSLTDRHRTVNKFEVNTLELLDEIYKVSPDEYHRLIDEWFKKIITYDLSIVDVDYIELKNGHYQITLKLNTKRFEQQETGQTDEISIDEPIIIGAFSRHPNAIDDEDILYYKSHLFKNSSSEVVLVLDELPSYIAIDPFGTRSDENFHDNLFEFEQIH